MCFEEKKIISYNNSNLHNKPTVLQPLFVENLSVRLEAILLTTNTHEPRHSTGQSKPKSETTLKLCWNVSCSTFPFHVCLAHWKKNHQNFPKTCVCVFWRY